jgi:hydroxymethylpyrimidine/phosphomethylpyrimidine kinase
MSVITALTAQNTRGVSGIHVIPAEFVAQQIADVIRDIPPKLIKTGMSWCLRG